MELRYFQMLSDTAGYLKIDQYSIVFGSSTLGCDKNVLDM